MVVDTSSRGRMHEVLSKSADSFDKAVADSTTNEIDVASQYNFSPERLRLFRNGLRLFPHYNSVSQFEDKRDVFTIKPESDDTMYIETAESITYTVQYDIETSFSFGLNQSLQDGDKFRVGPYNGTDGFYIEQRGSDHADNEVDIYRSQNGSVHRIKPNVQLNRKLTGFYRFSCRYNWYNVGHQVWTQTYTENGRQENDIIALTSTDGERGVDTANLPIRWEVTTSSTTSNLEVDVGSGGIITWGDVDNLTRQKKQIETETLSGSTDTWEPVLAMRTDPDQPNVNVELEQFSVFQYGANDNLEMIIVSVDPSKTDASGFSINEYHHDYNSAIETTNSVSEVPDATNGTQQDLGSSQKPGGHTIASAVQLSSGAKTESARTGQEQTISKKSILSSDIIVFLARSGTVGSDITFSWEVTQNW